MEIISIDEALVIMKAHETYAKNSLNAIVINNFYYLWI